MTVLRLCLFALIVTALTLAMIAWQGYDFSRISTYSIGDSGDGYTYAYHIFQAMDNLLYRPFNLGYGLIFYDPNTAHASAYTIAPYGIALPMLPFYILSAGNHILVSNWYVIATFPLTALAGYGLARVVVKAPIIVACGVGLFLTFVPVRVLHLAFAHAETLSTHWFLLNILLLHLILDAPRDQPARWRWAILLGITVWMNAITSGYLLVFFGFYALSYGLYCLVTRRDGFTARLLNQVAIAGLIAGVLIVPFVAYRLTSAVNDGHPFDQIIYYSARPINWIQSSSFLYYGLVGLAREEKMLFVGFVPLLLGLMAWRLRKHEPLIAFFAILVGTSYLFTLGPKIMFDLPQGEALAFSDQGVPSPYMLFYQLPLISSLRATPRFILVACVGLAMMGGLVGTWIVRRFSPMRAFAIVSIGIVLLGIELIPYNGHPFGARGDGSFRLANNPSTGRALGFSRPFVPDAVVEWLRQQPAGTPVLNLPANDDANKVYMFALPLHRQPMLNGEASFYPAWYINRDWNRFPSAYTLWVMRSHAIEYVLVYNPLLDSGQRDAIRQRISTYPDEIVAVTSLDEVDIYRVLPAPPGTSFHFEFDEYAPGDNWYQPERLETGETYNWVAGGDFTFNTPPMIPDAGVEMRIRLHDEGSAAALNQLTLTLNDQAIPLEISRADSGTVVLARIPAAVHRGQAMELRFTTILGARPIDLQVNGDTRHLVFSFDWLDLLVTQSQDGV